MTTRHLSVESSSTSAPSSHASTVAPTPNTLPSNTLQQHSNDDDNEKSRLSPSSSSPTAHTHHLPPRILPHLSPIPLQQSQPPLPQAPAQDRRRSSTTTKSIQKISQHALHVRVLRFAWCGAILVGERLIYSLMLRRCYWPTDPAWPEDETSVKEQYRVAIVADPQLTDWSSYGQKGILLALVEFYTDLFMSRSFDYFHSLHQPDAVLFLGDLMDGGRETVNDRATYAKNLRRFHRIFQTEQTAYNTRPIVQYTTKPPLPLTAGTSAAALGGGGAAPANSDGDNSNNAILTELARKHGDSFYRLTKPIPTTREEREQVRWAGKSLRLYVAGNHDIGFGETTIPEAMRLYRDEFGPLNYEIDVGHHRIVGLDTLTLSELARNSAIRTEAQHMLDQLAPQDLETSRSPRILFTHVPLYRPAHTYCGAERQTSKSIEQGRGHQYQNLVTADLSEEILDKVQPEMVFSGDDHDWCGVYHPHRKVGGVNRSGSELMVMYTIPEVTVPTFSFAQGVYQPGLVMLNLYNPRLAHAENTGIRDALNFTGTTSTTATFTYRSCMLPVQLHIYFSYGAFLGVTLAWTLIQRYRWLQRRSSSNGYFSVSTTSTSYRSDTDDIDEEEEEGGRGGGSSDALILDLGNDKSADSFLLQIPMTPDSIMSLSAPSSSCLTSRLYWRCVWLDVWHIASLPVILYVLLLIL